MQPVSFKFNEADLKRLDDLKEKLGMPNRMAVMRLALLSLGDLRTAQISNKPATYAEASGQASGLTDKQAIIDKLGGPFQMCPKHKGFYNSCWSLHR